MTNVLFSFPEFYSSYRKWLSANPSKASDYEVTFKWISYFVAARINNSQIVSELVYCLSNLLVLFNDHIIRREKHLVIPSSPDKLKIWLSVIEYCEVLLELGANQLWRSKGKWLIITSIQLIKCVSRLMLVMHYKEPVVQIPPIPVLNRKEIDLKPLPTSSIDQQLNAMSYYLHHSGRLIRKVDATPTRGARDWKPIQRAQFDNEQSLESALSGEQLIAESIYIAKPIAHLCALACCGEKSWKPYLLSLLLDVSSLQLYKKHQLSNVQMMEISRRHVSLLLYLIRSPFYDRHSRDRIAAILSIISRNVPFASIICVPLRKYVPFWQSIYFYMWSS